MDDLGHMGKISEDDLVDCLKRYNSSYSDYRYFHVHWKGTLIESKPGIPLPDQDMFHLLAEALLYLNQEKVKKEGFDVIGMTIVPESGMTEEQKAVREWLISG